MSPVLPLYFDLVLNRGVPQYIAKDINCLCMCLKPAYNDYAQGYAANLVMVLYLKVADGQERPLHQH